MKPKLTPILTTLIVLALVIIGWPFLSKWMAIIDDPQAIVSALRESSWSMATLIVLLILQVFLALIPGQALMVASGYVYGFWGGTLLTWFGLTLGGQMAFWLARRFGRPFAVKFVSPKILAKWDASSTKRGIVFYTISLVIPFFPNDAMCYVAGLSDISPSRFLLANMTGRMLATVATTFIGAYGAQFSVAMWVAVVILIAVLPLSWYNRHAFRNFYKGSKWFYMLRSGR